MSQRAYSPNRRTRTAAIVWCLFLGGIGAHKFYCGRPGWGVAYALLCWTWIPLIVSLFELLHYLTTSDQKFDEIYNP